MAIISPATLGGTWAWDGEFGSFRLGVVGAAATGPRLRNRGNTAYGNGALSAASLGRLNSAFGWRALNALLPLGGSTGSEGNAANTAVGAAAGLRLTNGARNVLVGASAGEHLVNGTANVYVGFVGSAAVPGLDTESQTIRIGDTAQTRAFVGGVSGVTTGLNDAVPVVVDSNGQLGTVVSTARAKDDITSLGDAATWIQRLRPVKFRYLQPFADGSRPLQIGLIAEEVEAVAPDLVAHDAAGRPATVKYHVLPSLLLAEVQRLERERAALAEQLAALKAFVEQRLGVMPLPTPK